MTSVPTEIVGTHYSIPGTFYPIEPQVEHGSARPRVGWEGNHLTKLEAELSLDEYMSCTLSCSFWALEAMNEHRVCCGARVLTM